MALYTICPEVLNLAIETKDHLYDILYVFIPSNSNKICVDKDKKLLKEYERIIDGNIDLITWYDALSYRMDLSFEFVEVTSNSPSLVLNICADSFDKTLISKNKSDYSSYFKFIAENNISLYDKETAKILLNYGTKSFPSVDFSKFVPVKDGNIFKLIVSFTKEFKYLIENNGLNKLLYQQDLSRVNEKDLQLLFYGISISYCQANDLKISPEVNSGRGPVDFNFSIGMKANINLEVKFSDNKKIYSGYKTQLEIYNKAERATDSIYLIVKTNSANDSDIQELLDLKSENKAKGLKSPEIIVVDATIKPSASKA